MTDIVARSELILVAPLARGGKKYAVPVSLADHFESVYSVLCSPNPRTLVEKFFPL